MPSAEEATYLLAERDVDALVSRLKENLRLSTLKSKGKRLNRPSPYRIPISRPWSDYEMCKNAAASREDPYELLQQLLRQGGLIKEAVKRLQADGQARKHGFYEESDGGDEEL